MSPQRVISILLILSAVFSLPASDLHFVVHGVDTSLGGVIGAGLYASDEGYLEPGFEIAASIAVISGDTATGVFEDLPAGGYVVAILHDVDGDGIMKKSGMGMPKEGYAFSGTTRAVTMPPKYRKAAVELDGIEDMTVNAYMKY